MSKCSKQLLPFLANNEQHPSVITGLCRFIKSSSPGEELPSPLKSVMCALQWQQPWDMEVVGTTLQLQPWQWTCSCSGKFRSLHLLMPALWPETCQTEGMTVSPPDGLQLGHGSGHYTQQAPGHLVLLSAALGKLPLWWGAIHSTHFWIQDDSMQNQKSHLHLGQQKQQRAWTP